MSYTCLIERLTGNCDTEAFTIYSPAGGYLLVSTYTKGAEEGVEWVRSLWQAGRKVDWRSGVSEAQRAFLRRLQGAMEVQLTKEQLAQAAAIPGSRTVRKS